MSSVDCAWRAILEAKSSLVEVAHPDIVLLTGSMGRGDWMRDPDGTLLSDVEMIFVTPHSWSRRALADFNKRLEIKYGVKVAVVGVSRRSFVAGHLRNFCYGRRRHVTLQYHDAMEASKTLYQHRPPAPVVRRATLSIRRWEGFRLLVNRMAELLTVRPTLGSSASILDLLKVVQACGDGALLVRSKYSPKSATRARHLVDLWGVEVGRGMSAEEEQKLLAPILVCYEQRRGNVLDPSCFVDLLDRDALATLVAFWLKDILQQLLSCGGQTVDELLEAYLSSSLTNEHDYYCFGIGGAMYQNAIVLLRNLYKGTPTPVAIHRLSVPLLHMTYVAIALCFVDMYGTGLIDASLLDRLLPTLGYSHGSGGRVDCAEYLYRLRGALS